MMKSYERLALLIVLFGAICALSPQSVFSQAARTTPSSDSAEGLAIVFPLKVEDPLRFQQIAAAPAAIQSLPGALLEALSTPQSLANDNPFPEAQSIDTFLTASFRKQLRTTPLINVSVASLQPQLTALENVSPAALLSLKEFSGVSTILFSMYEIIDNQLKFILWELRKDGQWAEYVSSQVSMFELPSAADNAVAYLLKKGLINLSAAEAPAIQAVNPDQAPIGQLPAIQPWGDKKEYENAQKAFKFAIGGTAIGISLTFVSAGIWQMYREAAYRDSAFDNALTISGIAAGTCAAVTATFLTFSVADAVRMLKASQ